MIRPLQAKLARAEASNLEKRVTAEARAEASRRFFVERRRLVDAQERELEQLRFGASYYPGPDGPASTKPKITPKQQAGLVARLAQTDRANKFAPHPPPGLRPPRGGGGAAAVAGKEDEDRAAEGAAVDGDEREREDGGHAPEYHELLHMMARAKQWMLTDLGGVEGDGSGGGGGAARPGKPKKKRAKGEKQWKGRRQLEFVRHSTARQEAEAEDELLLLERRKEKEREEARALPSISRQPATVR